MGMPSMGAGGVPSSGPPTGIGAAMPEMDAAGMTIGGHTVNHVVLSGATAEQQWLEISTCAARIESEIGVMGLSVGNIFLLLDP